MPNIETGAHPVSINNPHLTYGRGVPNPTLPTDDSSTGVWNMDYPSEQDSLLYQKVRKRSLANQNKLHVAEIETRKSEERLKRFSLAAVRLAAGALAFAAYQGLAQHQSQPHLNELGKASFMMALSPDLAQLFGVPQLAVQQSGSTCFIDLGIFGGCTGFNVGDYTVAAGGVFCRANGEWHQNLTGESSKYDSSCNLMPGYPRFDPVPGSTTISTAVPKALPTVQPTKIPAAVKETLPSDGLYRYNGALVTAYIPGVGNQSLKEFDFNGLHYSGSNSIPMSERETGLLMYVQRTDGGPAAYLVCTNGKVDWSTTPPQSNTRIIAGQSLQTYCLPPVEQPGVKPTEQPKAPEPTPTAVPAGPTDWTFRDNVTGEPASIIGTNGQRIYIDWIHDGSFFGMVQALFTNKAAVHGSIFSSMGPNSRGSDGQPIRIEIKHYGGYLYITASQRVHLVNTDPWAGEEGHKAKWVDLADTAFVWCESGPNGEIIYGLSSRYNIVLFGPPDPSGLTFGQLDPSLQATSFSALATSDGKPAPAGFGWVENPDARRGCREDWTK